MMHKLNCYINATAKSWLVCIQCAFKQDDAIETPNLLKSFVLCEFLCVWKSLRLLYIHFISYSCDRTISDPVWSNFCVSIPFRVYMTEYHSPYIMLNVIIGNLHTHKLLSCTWMLPPSRYTVLIFESMIMITSTRYADSIVLKSFYPHI